MKFRKEVQKQFQKAGWYEGRNVKEKFSSIPRFDEYPEFLKVFLYEYGDLEIETLTENAKGILNLKAIPSKLYDIQYCFETPRYFGNIIAYPIADYHWIQQLYYVILTEEYIWMVIFLVWFPKILK